MKKRQAKKIRRSLFLAETQDNWERYKTSTLDNVFRILARDQKRRSAFPWPRPWGKWDGWPGFIGKTN